MTKLGDRLKQGLTEAITMAKVMRENEGLKAHNKELRSELRKCHQMLVNQARTIRKYQEAKTDVASTDEEKRFS